MRKAAIFSSSLRSLLPTPVKRVLRSVHLRVAGNRPPIGSIGFGDLRRLMPIDRDFGFGRGGPVDRYYIEGFLSRRSADIRGRVLEIGDDTYTCRFGGERVMQRDILHVDDTNARATIVGDLAIGHGIPSDAFDCIVLTQTLHFIYDFHAAIRTLHRILRPGGVVLITSPGISQVATGNQWGATWFWAFTVLSLQRALDDVFQGGEVHVESQGNVLSAIAFLHGLAAEELTPEELDHLDPDYPVLVTARAVKHGRLA